jgi:RNA polymerase sigma-70 factor (ECF subfamily)
MELNKKEFNDLIERFSLFIKANIQKFNPQKEGIDPEDIYQEIKIKIWKIFKDGKKIRNYSSYIKKIVNSSVIDQIRKSRRERGIITKEKLKRISEKDINIEISRETDKHTKLIIGQALDSLSNNRRLVVRLYFLNLSIDEIASYLNWSKDKTRNLLYRGLKDLRKKLKAMSKKNEFYT